MNWPNAAFDGGPGRTPDGPLNEEHVTFYASENEDHTWSVYREVYPNSNSDEPIDGRTVRVGTFTKEHDADYVAGLLYLEAHGHYSQTAGGAEPEPDAVAYALDNALDLAGFFSDSGPGNTWEAVKRVIAELGEQGYTIIPTPPLNGVIHIHDPLAGRTGTHVFVSHAQFEYAAVRVQLAKQRDKRLAGESVLS